MESSIASAWKQVCIFFITYRWVIIILICLIVFVYVCYKKLTDRWEELTNAGKVFYAGLGSIILGFLLLFGIAASGIAASGIAAGSSKSIIEGSAGFWNFIILIVSAPVAFAIWHFRDENNKQQIENQRKDINLKEFQKLSEWVSGAHLPEIKTVSRTTQKSSSEDGVEITEQTTEQSEEYAKKPDAADFDTFSKRDGAVALQISAIYNLLPFFRGDYGESFRRPAFNLLKSAWQAMQQESLNQLRVDNLSDEVQKNIFNELQDKAKSPMGVALTHVLLSLDQENKKLNFQDFPEMLINICLAGMNFQLNGVFKTKNNLPKLDLSGADLRAAVFNEAELQEAILIKADLRGANLSKAKLQKANLKEAALDKANLEEANLEEAKLAKAQLNYARLIKTKLQKADLKEANLERADLEEADLEYANLQEASLYLAKLQEVSLLFAKLQKASLSCANLQQTKLQYADLQQTNLQQTNLQQASLLYANLQQADLQQANLQKARLFHADLQKADLKGVDLKNADLENANLQGTNLKGGNLQNAYFNWLQLKNSMAQLFYVKITAYDFIKKIYPDWKKENDPEWEALTVVEQIKAMQKFCDETGMLIFDEDGEQQIMPLPLGK